MEYKEENYENTVIHPGSESKEIIEKVIKQVYDEIGKPYNLELILCPSIGQFWQVRHDDGTYLNVWFEETLGGIPNDGLSVEAGYGPNCYDTIGELKEAIHNGLTDLRLKEHH